jgi:hypothetical protein
MGLLQRQLKLMPATRAVGGLVACARVVAAGGWGTDLLVRVQVQRISRRGSRW